MKALTVHYPFSAYLATANKEYETRSWSTDYRGLIAIHAGKTWNSDLREQASLLSRRYRDLPDIDNPSLGCVLAIGLLENCIPSERLRESIGQIEKAVGNFANGRYGWKIKILEQFEHPIPAKGQQGLWNWDFPEEIAAKRIAIVGSRDYPDLDAVVKYVRSLPLDTTIISGGAQGVDMAAENAARERGMRVIRIPVDTRNLPNHYERRKQIFAQRAMRRNQYIVEMAGSVVAFHHNNSPGTQDSINKAKAIGRPVTINPLVSPKQEVLVQKVLTGFLDTYDEAAYIERGQVKAESSAQIALREWDKPWLIDKHHVWCWKRVDNKWGYYPVHIDSEDAKRQQRNLSGVLYRSETIRLRDWLEEQAGWQDVPFEVADVADMGAGYFLRSGSTKQRVPLDKVVFIQEQYKVAIAMAYYRSLSNVDDDGYLPHYVRFGGDDIYYVFNGTHRTLAHKWAGREFIFADVMVFPESFIEACGMIELEDENPLIYLDVLNEALKVIQGEAAYA